MVSLCFLSSFIFLSNVLHNYWLGNITYSILFGILCATSIAVHYHDNFYTNIIDKFSVTSIVIYGGYTYYNKTLEYGNLKQVAFYVTPLLFLLTIYLYIYGFFTDQYCFDADQYAATQYHVLMHIISSVGHHVIVML